MAKTLKPEERKAILSRLARNEVVGLSDIKLKAATYDLVEELAVERLIKNGHANASTADMLYGMVVKLLEDARLTISLKAGNWFYQKNKSKNYGTLFERGTSGASNDFDRRDGAENSMFGYNKGVLSEDDNVKAAQNRLLTLGVRPSADFQPAMRPRYAAVDFGECVNGALSKYGKSYLVLKEHLKHNATYTHCDSFEVEVDMIARKDEYEGEIFDLQRVGGNYFQLGKIVLFCHPQILGELVAYARETKKKGSQTNILGGMIYIEAQVHADIVFQRDVAKLCISTADLTQGPSAHPKPKKFIWDKDDAAKTKANAIKFARDNGIEFVQVP